MTAIESIHELQHRVGQSISGQERVVQRLVLALPANGNLLLKQP